MIGWAFALQAPVTGVSPGEWLSTILGGGVLTALFFLWKRVDRLAADYHNADLITAKSLGSLDTGLQGFKEDTKRRLESLESKLDGVGSRIAAHTQTTMTNIEDRLTKQQSDLEGRVERLEGRRAR